VSPNQIYALHTPCVARYERLNSLSQYTNTQPMLVYNDSPA